jgi:hypothetical protein
MNAFPRCPRADLDRRFLRQARAGILDIGKALAPPSSVNDKAEGVG